MHDALAYTSHDPVHRSFHHSDLTFRMLYAFTENFVLPLSHDEVVYGKGSLLGKMPGDDWQKFANLRALYGSMWTQPGKKLLFMGGEFGRWASGPMTGAWVGCVAVCSPRGTAEMGARSQPALPWSRRFMKWIATRRVSNGSTATTPTAASLR
jgi:hypothetical protein